MEHVPYEGGIDLGDGWEVHVEATRGGDTWVTVTAAGEAGTFGVTIGPSSDEMRELAGALRRCANAADEARQSYSASNGNGAHQ